MKFVKKTKKKISHRLVRIVTSEIIACILVNLISLWIFVKLTKSVFSRDIGWFDLSITFIVQSVRAPAVTNIMKAITLFGGPGILFGTIVIVIGLLAYKRNKRSVVFLSLMITGVILNVLLKFLFARERPSDARLVDEYFYSFPSGHAMNSFIFYGSIAYMFFHYTRDRVLGIAVSVALSILILLIGISRIYLGVHYPSDVLAGYLAGAWWFATVLLFEKVYYNHGLRS